MAKASGSQKQHTEDSVTDLATLVARIDEIVAQMERSDMPLEESVMLFEEGIALTRKAQTLLETAQQRVTMMIDEGGEGHA